MGRAADKGPDRAVDPIVGRAERRISCPVNDDPFYAPENMRHLERSIRQLEHGDVSERELRES